MWGANPDCRLVKKLEYYQRSRRTKNYCIPQYCEAMALKHITQISCGTSHTLILDQEGYAYAAGCSDDGQLGVIHYHFAPKNCEQPFVYLSVFTRDNPGKKICAGDGFSVFLDTLGSVYSCGKANFGRLG